MLHKKDKSESILFYTYDNWIKAVWESEMLNVMNLRTLIRVLQILDESMTVIEGAASKAQAVLSFVSAQWDLNEGEITRVIQKPKPWIERWLIWMTTQSIGNDMRDPKGYRE
jgi:hypothetical protein